MIQLYSPAPQPPPWKCTALPSADPHHVASPGPGDPRVGKEALVRYSQFNKGLLRACRASGPVLGLAEADGNQRQPLPIRSPVFVLEGCMYDATEA